MELRAGLGVLVPASVESMTTAHPDIVCFPVIEESRGRTFVRQKGGGWIFRKTCFLRQRRPIKALPSFFSCVRLRFSTRLALFRLPVLHMLPAHRHVERLSACSCYSAVYNTTLVLLVRGVRGEMAT